MASINFPSAEHADTTLAFVFDAWNMVPYDRNPDPAELAANLALANAFAEWRRARGV